MLSMEIITNILTVYLFMEGQTDIAIDKIHHKHQNSVRIYIGQNKLRIKLLMMDFFTDR